MAIYKSDIVEINLNSGTIHRSFASHAIGMTDSNGDQFGIRAYRDGEPVDLDGIAVQGFFRNAHGENIAITTGNTVTGNTAVVTLPQACYNYEGAFTLAIKLVGGGVTGTVRIVDGTVSNTNTDGAVAPTETVPTYQEILATYDDMLDALEEFAHGFETNTENLWTLGDLDIPRETGYLNISSLGESFELPAGTYTISANAFSEYTADGVVRMLWKVNNVNTYVDVASSGRQAKTFTFSSAGTLVRFQTAKAVADAAGYGGYFRNVMLVSGSSAARYVPRYSAVDARLRTMVVYPSDAGDWATDAQNIRAALTTAGYCKLAAGVFRVNVMGFPSGSTAPIMIEGSGKDTVILVNSEYTSNNYGIRISNNCIIKDLTIRASNTEYTPTDPYQTSGIKHGVRIAQSTSTKKCHAVIENVSIENFSGAGILVDGTGQGTSDGSHILNCWIDNCGAGIWLNTHAEYCRVDCCNVSGCWYGIICDAGNSSICNSGFSGNKVGFYMNNSGGDLGNNSHSQVVGCIFNHIDSDPETLGKGWSIYVDGATSGLQFVGGQIFYGGIYIKNSKGVAISGFNIGKQIDGGSDVGIKVQFDHTDSYSYGFAMANCICDIAPRFVFPQNDSKFKYHIDNCYTRTGTAVTV